jgi:hypothetical protein
MVDKYYTPELAEFHEGFEFESYNNMDWHWKKDSSGWKKLVYDKQTYMTYPLSHIKGALGISWARVKYLDQEDIESLGFISDRPYNGEFRASALMRWDGKEETLKLSYNEKNNFISMRLDCNYGEEHLFQGILKNKSELKQVLKQIGYE